MDAPFIELAQAVRDTHTIGLQTLARLVGIAPDDEIETMRRRKALLLDAANLLTEQAPHEALIRSIVQVGGLADLPEYSPSLATLRVGSTGLFRGDVFDIMPTECEARFQTARGSSRVWVSRAALVGLQLEAPTMWSASKQR